MNYALAIQLLLICSAVALADTMTTRIDGAIITTGMSIAEVVHRGRKPDRIVVIENDQGAAIGERWEFFEGSRLVSLTVVDGIVRRIVEK